MEALPPSDFEAAIHLSLDAGASGVALFSAQAMTDVRWFDVYRPVYTRQFGRDVKRAKRRVSVGHAGFFCLCGHGLAPRGR